MTYFTDIVVVIVTLTILKMRDNYKEKQANAILLNDANDDKQNEDVIKKLDITQPSFTADGRTVA